MDLNKLLKFTRSYRGLFDERISTWLYRRYIKKGDYSGITWFNTEDIAIHYTSKEYIERRVWMLGDYEPEVNSVFKAFVPIKGTVLDIGANIGINSIRLSKCVTLEGKVYSFEPIPFNQKRLEKNLLLNSVQNVSVAPIALGLNNEEVRVLFNEQEENMGAISLRNQNEEGILVQVRNGDDWIKENNIEKLDFMKIDVEGFEWNVISGLKETIGRDHPRILIEWDLNYLLYSGKSADEWQQFIDKFDYRIYQINRYELKQLTSIREALDGNLLFI
jgi:FkbM family methyltransferase